MENTSTEPKLYQQTWFLIVASIFLAPVGIALIWTNKNAQPFFTNKGNKIWVSIACGILFLVALTNNKGESRSNTQTEATNTNVEAKKETANLLKVGATGKTEKFEITLTQVSPRGAIGKSFGDQFLGEKAPEGGTFITLIYKVKNISKEPVSSMPSVTLISPDGVKYDEATGAEIYFATEQHFDKKILSDLNPGITLRDGKVFEVAKELWQKKGWKLIFDADSDIEFAAN